MSSIGAALLENLRSIERSGDFCIPGLRETNPAAPVDIDRRLATRSRQGSHRRAPVGGNPGCARCRRRPRPRRRRTGRGRLLQAAGLRRWRLLRRSSRNGEGAGMFATMVVVLPSIHNGGALVVRHFDREIVLDPHPEEPSEIGFAAFYADCVHEVRPHTGRAFVCRPQRRRCGHGLGRGQGSDGGRLRDLPCAPDHRGERQRRIHRLRRLETSWER